jgi:spermidine synthase
MDESAADRLEWFEETLWPDWAQRLRVKEVLFRDRTEHQDLIVFESFAWGRVLALDGVVQTTTADEFVYHEMLVHVPILAHGRAEDVLIIGGGDGGCLREALRHERVRRATLVEIDAGVIEFCRRYLPSLSAGAFDHEKARIVITDGARYVAETDARYDVVIVDSTDPQGPGAVLFSEEFYRGCRRLLRPGGVMTTQCGNPSIYPDELSFTQARQRSAGFAHVTYYFAAVPTYIGGNMALGFATDDPTLLGNALARPAGSPVPAGLRYYTSAVHAGSFAHPAWMVQRVGY